MTFNAYGTIHEDTIIPDDEYYSDGFISVYVCDVMKYVYNKMSFLHKLTPLMLVLILQ